VSWLGTGLGLYGCVLLAGSLITIGSRLHVQGAVGDWWRCWCENCGAPIPNWHSNLPILNFLWLRGRSACCGAPIHWRHPLLECGLGVLLFLGWRLLAAALAP